MSTIREIFSNFGHSYDKDVTGTYGVEIETEVPDHTEYPKGFLKPMGEDKKGNSQWETPKMPSWKAVYDGSLRNYGIEFVLKYPHTLHGVEFNLNQFGSATEGVNFIRDAPATSVHIHINMLDEKLLTLANFIQLWILFENVLLEFSGETRRSNCFALGLRAAEAEFYTFVRMITNLHGCKKNALTQFDESSGSSYSCKYSALNLAPIKKFGSIEARSLRGTTDVSLIMKWIRILDRILKVSRTIGLTPSGILNSYHNQGLDFFSEVFGENAKDLYTKDTQSHIERNIFYCHQLAQLVPDWGMFGVDYEVLIEKGKKEAGTLKGKTTLQPLIGKPKIPNPLDYPSPATYEAAMNVYKSMQQSYLITDILSLNETAFVDNDVETEEGEDFL